MGLSTTTWQGLQELDPAHLATTNATNCTYLSNAGNVVNDITTFPATAGPIDNVGSIPAYTATGVSTSTGYYSPIDNHTNDPKSIRFASFNVADNIATLIRQDTVVSPVLMVIGLVYPNGTEEVLDSDWLARVANDQDYLIQTADSLVKNNMYPSRHRGG